MRGPPPCSPVEVPLSAGLSDHRHNYVTVASIEEAVCTLHIVVHYTPASCQLNALSGARVFLTCENFQCGGILLTGGNVEWLRPCSHLS